jgi:hypothetical protein
VNSEFELNNSWLLLFEKNCIFLKASEVCNVLAPKVLLEVKFKILLLSVGDSIKCAGVEVNFEDFFALNASHKLFDFETLSLVFEYFNELPTIDENVGLTL